MSSKKRSIAWTFFKKSTEISTLAECVFCGVRVAHSNPNNLLEHLRGKHRGETSHLWNEELTPEMQLKCSDEQSPSTTKQCTKTEDDELNLGSDTNMYCGETSDHLETDEQDIEIKQKSLDEAPVSSIKLDLPGNRKCRSVVWMCFEKTDNAASAVCTLCGKTIRQVCGSTSNLLKHLLNKHPVEYESIVSDRSLTISCESFPVEKEPRPVGRCSGLKRRSRSILWEYFMKNSADESQVMCSFCGRMLKQPIGSTSNLIKHLYAKHRNEYQKLYPDENSVDDGLLSAKTEAEELLSNGMQLRYVETEELNCTDHKEEEDEKEEDDEEEEEEKDGEEDASIPEMFTKVQNIWLKHCEEREKEFNRFMMTKRKEALQIHESMQKLKQQMALLSKDVRRQESKRRVELKRQDQMDRQFLTQTEASSRKQKYCRNFLQACSLVKGIVSDQTPSSYPVTTANTRTYEDIADGGVLDSESDPTAPHPDASVSVETVAMDVWPVGSLSQNNVDRANESRLPLNKIKRKGWTCNTIVCASKRQKTE